MTTEVETSGATSEKETASATTGQTIKLNVGCGRDIKTDPGWKNLDSAPLAGVDIAYDLEMASLIKIPLPDDSVDEFLLSHVIEHIKSPLPMMQELHRVAAKNAKMVVRCPYGSSDDAFEDPTHVRQYFLNSFLYFSQPAYWRADYGYRGDWQPEVIHLVVPESYKSAKFEDLKNIIHARRNVVREMVAELRAVKPIRAPRQELQRAPQLNFVLGR